MPLALSQGKTAEVDASDVEVLSRWKWCADCMHGKTYAIRNVYTEGKHRVVYMHREIWELHNGAIPRHMEIDHIDGDPLNNKISNLRMCTHAQNVLNRRKNGSSKTSIFKGVRRKENGKWEARITHDGEQYALGYYQTEVEAALAYDRAALRLHGEYASLNIGGDAGCL